MFAITLVMIYGIYRIIQEGVWPAWPDGTILVTGGILSVIFVVLYMRSIEAGSGKSWAKAASAFGAFVPYVYSLYVIGYVGVWSLVQLVTVGFTWSGLVCGSFGLVFGYRILQTFYDITELSAQKA
ncbi:hypothetical protein EHI44_30450 [Rhizobium leguminosarum]|uniref:hypothetical protein n=1 Tax=Rhizobium leguminosarum TaxID=384 RepID=UPI000FF742A0|nr:hypothetical protein [Rhizobium leguminosarum]MBY5828569.1 hypothetical protein [Rhizobium leguminosarum]MBY5856306.1 hypothetical protein [Rhizobium leguminosarum]RWY80015.1 hypothetical protein EHI44_30450 [Rhizobium leguminosarum]